jgi:hypothetical protein
LTPGQAEAARHQHSPDWNRERKRIRIRRCIAAEDPAHGIHAYVEGKNWKGGSDELSLII